MTLKSFQKSQIFVRSISMLVLSVFLLDSTVQASQLSVLSQQAPLIVAPKYLKLPNIIPSAEVAQVDDYFLNDLSHKPILYLIQDAHESLDAQKNIYQLLKMLVQERGVKKVYFEGGATELDKSFYQFSNKPKLNQDVWEALFESGEMNGVEFYSTQAPEYVRFLGVEDESLYFENVYALKKVFDLQDLTKERLNEVERKIENLKGVHLTGDLKKVWDLQQSFDKKHIDLFQYANEVSRWTEKELRLDMSQVRNQDAWPQLVRLQQIRILEQGIQQSQKALRVELQLIQERNRGEVFQPFSFLWNPQQHALAQGHLRWYFEKCLDLLKKNNQSFSKDYPHLESWIGFHILKDEIKASDLFNEIQVLTNKVIENIEVSNNSKSFLSWLQKWNLFQKLILVKLNKEEWLQILNQEEAYDPVKLLNNPEYFQEPIESLDILHQLYQESLQNYHCVTQRDQTLFNKMIQDITASPSDSVLVMGGFHSDAVKALLKQERQSFVVFNPGIKDLSHTLDYKSLMTRNSISSMKEVSRDQVAVPYEAAFGADSKNIIPYQEAVRQQAQIALAASLGKVKHGDEPWLSAFVAIESLIDENDVIFRLVFEDEFTTEFLKETLRNISDSSQRRLQIDSAHLLKTFLITTYEENHDILAPNFREWLEEFKGLANELYSRIMEISDAENIAGFLEKGLLSQYDSKGTTTDIAKFNGIMDLAGIVQGMNSPVRDIYSASRITNLLSPEVLFSHSVVQGLDFVQDGEEVVIYHEEIDDEDGNILFFIFIIDQTIEQGDVKSTQRRDFLMSTVTGDVIPLAVGHEDIFWTEEDQLLHVLYPPNLEITYDVFLKLDDGGFEPLKAPYTANSLGASAEDGSDLSKQERLKLRRNTLKSVLDDLIEDKTFVTSWGLVGVLVERILEKEPRLAQFVNRKLITNDLKKPGIKDKYTNLRKLINKRKESLSVADISLKTNTITDVRRALMKQILSEIEASNAGLAVGDQVKLTSHQLLEMMIQRKPELKEKIRLDATQNDIARGIIKSSALLTYKKQPKIKEGFDYTAVATMKQILDEWGELPAKGEELLERLWMIQPKGLSNKIEIPAFYELVENIPYIYFHPNYTARRYRTDSRSINDLRRTIRRLLNSNKVLTPFQVWEQLKKKSKFRDLFYVDFNRAFQEEAFPGQFEEMTREQAVNEMVRWILNRGVFQYRMTDLHQSLETVFGMKITLKEVRKAVQTNQELYYHKRFDAGRERRELIKTILVDSEDIWSISYSALFTLLTTDLFDEEGLLSRLSFKKLTKKQLNLDLEILGIDDTNSRLTYVDSGTVKPFDYAETRVFVEDVLTILNGNRNLELQQIFKKLRREFPRNEIYQRLTLQTFRREFTNSPQLVLHRRYLLPRVKYKQDRTLRRELLRVLDEYPRLSRYGLWSRLRQRKGFENIPYYRIRPFFESGSVDDLEIVEHKRFGNENERGYIRTFVIWILDNVPVKRKVVVGDIQQALLYGFDINVTRELIRGSIFHSRDGLHSDNRMDIDQERKEILIDYFSDYNLQTISLSQLQSDLRGLAQYLDFSDEVILADLEAVGLLDRVTLETATLTTDGSEVTVTDPLDSSGNTVRTLGAAPEIELGEGGSETRFRVRDLVLEGKRERPDTASHFGYARMNDEVISARRREMMRILNEAQELEVPIGPRELWDSLRSRPGFELSTLATVFYDLKRIPELGNHPGRRRVDRLTLQEHDDSDESLMRKLTDRVMSEITSWNLFRSNEDKLFLTPEELYDVIIEAHNSLAERLGLEQFVAFISEENINYQYLVERKSFSELETRYQVLAVTLLVDYLNEEGTSPASIEEHFLKLKSIDPDLFSSIESASFFSIWAQFPQLNYHPKIQGNNRSQLGLDEIELRQLQYRISGRLNAAERPLTSLDLQQALRIVNGMEIELSELQEELRSPENRTNFFEHPNFDSGYEQRLMLAEVWAGADGIMSELELYEEFFQRFGMLLTFPEFENLLEVNSDLFIDYRQIASSGKARVLRIMTKVLDYSERSLTYRDLQAILKEKFSIYLVPAYLYNIITEKNSLSYSIVNHPKYTFLSVGQQEETHKDEVFQGFLGRRVYEALFVTNTRITTIADIRELIKRGYVVGERSDEEVDQAIKNYINQSILFRNGQGQFIGHSNLLVDLDFVEPTRPGYDQTITEAEVDLRFVNEEVVEVVTQGPSEVRKIKQAEKTKLVVAGILAILNEVAEEQKYKHAVEKRLLNANDIAALLKERSPELLPSTRTRNNEIFHYIYSNESLYHHPMYVRPLRSGEILTAAVSILEKSEKKLGSFDLWLELRDSPALQNISFRDFKRAMKNRDDQFDLFENFKPLSESDELENALLFMDELTANKDFLEIKGMLRNFFDIDATPESIVRLLGQGIEIDIDNALKQRYFEDFISFQVGGGYGLTFVGVLKALEESYGWELREEELINVIQTSSNLSVYKYFSPRLIVAIEAKRILDRSDRKITIEEIHQRMKERLPDVKSIHNDNALSLLDFMMERDLVGLYHHPKFKSKDSVTIEKLWEEFNQLNISEITGSDSVSISKTNKDRVLIVTSYSPKQVRQRTILEELDIKYNQPIPENAWTGLRRDMTAAEVLSAIKEKFGVVVSPAEFRRIALRKSGSTSDLLAHTRYMGYINERRLRIKQVLDRKKVTRFRLMPSDIAREILDEFQISATTTDIMKDLIVIDGGSYIHHPNFLHQREVVQAKKDAVRELLIEIANGRDAVDVKFSTLIPKLKNLYGFEVALRSLEKIFRDSKNYYDFRISRQQGDMTAHIQKFKTDEPQAQPTKPTVERAEASSLGAAINRDDVIRFEESYDVTLESVLDIISATREVLGPDLRDYFPYIYKQMLAALEKESEVQVPALVVAGEVSPEAVLVQVKSNTTFVIYYQDESYPEQIAVVAEELIQSGLIAREDIDSHIHLVSLSDLGITELEFYEQLFDGEKLTGKNLARIANDAGIYKLREHTVWLDSSERIQTVMEDMLVPFGLPFEAERRDSLLKENRAYYDMIKLTLASALSRNPNALVERGYVIFKNNRYQMTDSFIASYLEGILTQERVQDLIASMA